MSELPNFVPPEGVVGDVTQAPAPALDREALAPLVAALQRDLERLDAGGGPSGAELDRLRAEVAELWAVLEGGELTSAGLPQKLSSVHGLLNQAPVGEAEAGAFKAAGYFAAIGRMLGLD
jgi:hypothetical protein